MPTLFISDLHLDDARPQVTELFGEFIDGEARGADALYILGDLFEAWVGDDDPSETGRFVASKLRGLSDAGVPVHFMHGNRDFLVGRDHAARAGMRLLPDPSVVLLHGRPVLLMHGDTLCTDDVAYQQFRARSRDPRWQAEFLSQPLPARQAFAEQARAASRAHQAGLREAGAMDAITDVVPATVEATFRTFGIDTLVHGHTHRPAVHELDIDGRRCTRTVLGDWHEQGSVLRVDETGAVLSSL